MKIAIIGGGASGMMAAATLLENGFSGEIFLFEKNPNLGAKVLITGGGRCNLTTGIYKNQELLKNYPRGAEFLKYGFQKFGPRQVVKRFENHGLPTKVEADNRVFPTSNKSKSVVETFEKIFAQYPNFISKLGETVQNTELIQNGKNSQFLIQTNKGEFISDFLILATGGNSYIQGNYNGYNIAESLGHSITKLGPSLTSFVASEQRPKNLSGISLPNAKIQAFDIDGNKKLGERNGAFLFTHYGISGPAVFALSSLLARENISNEQKLLFKLQLDSDQNFDFYQQYFLQKISENPQKTIFSLLSEFFPKRLVQELLNLSKLEKTITIGEIPKTQRKNLIHLLSGEILLTIIDRKQGEEFVSAGGVDLSEVNPKTMESKICSNFYLCGELLNIDGFTGGFNLQAARTTGRLAALSILEN